MNGVPRVRLAVTCAFLVAAGASAATIVVGDASDSIHSPGCATTGQAPCTLRDAITFANSNPGSDVVHFAIPGAGPHVILPASDLPVITESVTLDGYTQPGASPNTLATADDAVLKIVLDAGPETTLTDGFSIASSGVTIRGFVIMRFIRGAGVRITGPGSGNTIQGNFIGTNAAGTFSASNSYGVHLVGGTQFNQIGGSAPGDRNIISGNPLGLTLEGSQTSHNTITGNFIGPRAHGLFGTPNSGGLRIYSPDNRIGGTAPGDRNVISGNSPGVMISGPDATDNLILGNYIGANAAGTAQLFNNVAMVIEEGASRNVIGGAAAGAGNVIVAGGVGIVSGGIALQHAATTGNRFQGNRFGVLPDGSAVGGGSIGITDASETLIGGVGPGEANEIAYGLAAITMGQLSPGTCQRNTISRNSIHDNSQGIALSVGGDPTPNDDLDADTGPNGLQNYPELEAVTPSGVRGVLKSAPSASYTLEFFASPSCSRNGNGQGKAFLASTTVTTDGAGNASFSLALSIPPGQRVTATATDADGNTSEFSRCMEVAQPAIAVDPSAGPASDGNGVFEPQESVSVEPAWPNPTETPLPLTGVASNPSGPSGPAYSLPDSSADYGSIPGGSVQSCAETPDCYRMSVSGARPSVHWDATFVEALSDSTARTWTLHLGDSFTDVPRSQLYYRRIETALHAGITAGCAATAYCPDQAVPRDQVAIFLARALTGGSPLPRSGAVDGASYDCEAGGVSLFTDVAPADISCRAIHYITAQNVTSGCAPSLFCPSLPVTRGQMASLVAKAVKAPAGGAAVPISDSDPDTGLSYSCTFNNPVGTHFLDVPMGHPFCKHIHYLWARGFVAGCGSDLYCPNGDVTRGEMAKFLANAFGLLLYGP